MFQPSKMKETAMVHQAQFLKVPEIMQRQVPMIVEQVRNDEKNQKNKANCRHKRKEGLSQQQAQKNQKSIPNSRRSQDQTQQQVKSKSIANRRLKH